MWIEDLTKALYYLSMTEIRHHILIKRIEDDVIYFTNETAVTVQDLIEAYNLFFKTGERMPVSVLLR